jgi:hypothetical protein
MDRREYTSLIALATVAIGVVTTSKPLGAFFLESTRQFMTTTAAMAWITWWALVTGFAIAGGVEALTSNEAVADLLDGHDAREIGYESLFGFISSSYSYSAIATAKNLFKKDGSAAATLGAFVFASTNLVIESALHQELAQLSRRFVFVAFPASVVALLVSLLYKTNSGAALTPYLPLAISASFAIVVAPLVLVLASMLRLAPVFEYTVTVAPFVPPAEWSWTQEPDD